MVRKNIIIQNPTGLHLRPAGVFCHIANQFQCKITFEYEGGYNSAKSVLGVLGACIKTGDEITLICEGDDEQEAMDAMIEAIESGLGE